MRRDVRKILFVGLTKSKDAFFQEAQNQGFIHFIDMTGASASALPEDLEKIGAALKVLRGLPVLEQEESDDFSLADDYVSDILRLQSSLDKINEGIRILKLEMARVEPFGEFQKEDVEYIRKEGKRHVQFFWAKQGATEELELPEEILYINSDHGIDYFISVSKQLISFPPLVEMTVERPYPELKSELDSSVRERGYIEEQLKTFQKYSTFLHHALVQKLNKYHLHSTQNYVELAMDGEIFAIEGWIPDNKFAEAEKLTEKHQVHFEEIAIEEGDVVPTVLENQGASRIGEDLVHIYDTPSATDKDPSLWVLVFFALFFAMIIGDAGYGTLFVGIVLYLGYKFKKMTLLGLRVWKLAGILAGACIVWGVLVNTFFGVAPAPDSPLMKFSLVNWLVKKRIAYHVQQHDATYEAWTVNHPNTKGMNDPQEIIMNGIEKGGNGETDYVLYAEFADQVMMELALFIGMVHIILSLLRYTPRNYSQIGWVLFIIGCYLYLPSYLGATSMIQYILGWEAAAVAREGLYLIIGGFSLAIILAVIVHKAKGLLESMNVIQVFGDVLSYLRLYALGMAGGLMSATINEGAAALGGVLGILVILAGHIFNITLSIMGGVIHGLRLNFLEWYHYSFEGGGKPFKPLEKVKIE